MVPSALVDPIAAQLFARLKQDPGDQDTFSALCDHLRRSGDAHTLADVMGRSAAAQPDPERKSALLAELAELQANELGDLVAAIQTLRAALLALPGDVSIMHQLALRLLERAQGAEPEVARADRGRAAELFYQIALGVDEAQAPTYLESALSELPSHEGALTLLERMVPAEERNARLAPYWVAYVAEAEDGPDLDARRLLLGTAYVQAEQPDDAIFCLQPVAERGSKKAHELLQQAYALQASGTPKPDGAQASDRLPIHQQRPDEHQPTPQADSVSAAIAQLRKRVHEALTARRHDEAAGLCQQILGLDDTDAEAFSLLESHHRKRRDYSALCGLLLASTNMPGLAVDARKLRLREVATLSENKLRDAEGAISAWQSVVTLDPHDREAGTNLKRLLKRNQAWDALVAVLEREAESAVAAEDKMALLREIASVHRDKRQDNLGTAQALSQLYTLAPLDRALRDELCDLHIALEQWSQAVPLLRQRAESGDEPQWHSSMKVLAAVLHERLGDADGAHAICEQILERKVSDASVWDRMERIDQESQRYRRLLSTLERRALLSPKGERPPLFVRMATIAEEQLGDIDKAADYLGDALDLAPDHPEALRRLVESFERAGRYAELAELLRERVLLEKEPKNRAPLQRRIAEVLAEHLQDEQGAADAYRRLLEIEEDEEALRFLRRVATQIDDTQELTDVLRRLSTCVKDAAERRDLLFDLAILLHERLGRTEEACQALKTIIEEVEPSFEPAVEQLLSMSELISDNALLALALERRIALCQDPEDRLPLAQRLADLSEQVLHDDKRALAALFTWAQDSPFDPVAHRRLRKLLTAAQSWQPLLATLDALAECEEETSARDEASIAAAQLAFEQHNDPQGAWRRLEPLVEQQHEAAETALRQLADDARLHTQLAGLYVRLAQAANDPKAQGVHWRKVVELYADKLDDAPQAFEASLRLLATDLSDRTSLSWVDRLAAKSNHLRRLAQVYDRLLKSAQEDSDKVTLLVRHADLLEAEHAEEALDRILRACALVPTNFALLERAETLAARAHRSEELLLVYDRSRARSETDGDKIHLLLRAAKLCDGGLRDRERANQYLKTALASLGTQVELSASIEAAAKALDGARAELGHDQAQRTLIRSHREVAEDAEPALAERLLLRGAELLGTELDDERGAFDFLRQGVALLPRSEAVYAAFFTVAEKLKRLDAVDVHLARLIEEAIDSSVTVELLKRRGALLEGPLDRPQDAAAAYAKHLQLRPDDAEAASKLHASLRRGGRFQELLLALNKQRERTHDSRLRLSLLKEIARIWEFQLKNRWEALEAWQTVLRQGDDEEAGLAVARLDRGHTYDPEKAAEESAAFVAADEAAAAIAAPTAESAPEPIEASEPALPITDPVPSESHAAKADELPLPALSEPTSPVELVASAESAPFTDEPHADDKATDLAAMDAQLEAISLVEVVDVLEHKSAPPPPPLAKSTPPPPVTRSGPPPIPSLRASAIAKAPSRPPPLPPARQSSAKLASPTLTAPPVVSASPRRASLPPPLPSTRRAKQ